RPYRREIAEGAFARKGVEAVGRDDFERLLRRIDRRMVSPFGPHDWLSLLEPLFELLRPLPEGGHVPAPLLRRFFEAKGYDDLARTLDADAYDADALRAALADALPDIDLEEPARGEAEAALLAVATDAAEPPAVTVPEGDARSDVPASATGQGEADAAP